MLDLYLEIEEAKLLAKEVRNLSEKTIFCFRGVGNGKTEIARHIVGIFPKIHIVKEEDLSVRKNYMIVLTDNIEKIKGWAKGKKYRVLVFSFDKV